MKKITKLMPKWGDILYEGRNYDEIETFRTIRHIFRSLWVYFAILDDRFNTNVEIYNIKSLKKFLENIYDFQTDFFLIILLYHDIGRPFNRVWHTYESAKIIKEKNLLNDFSLSIMQKKILYGVIKYHLLLGTIFTGESSYTGAISLYNDNFLEEVWNNKESISYFFNTLTAFTVIDIWGYDYSKIYNHYFSFYTRICNNLTKIFIRSIPFQGKDRLAKLYKGLSKIDVENIKWRLACSFRIFQFVNIRPYLTEKYFYSKIDEALNSIGINWELFQNRLGKNHNKIQFKYTLPIMMVLASGNFKREPLSGNETVLPNIFNFWLSCAQIVNNFYQSSNLSQISNHNVWNFIFNLPLRWFFKSYYRKYILSDLFLKKINQSIPTYNNEIQSYLVNIKLGS
jgi:hypothetical protein